MRLAVIGDVHANAEALEAALRKTEQHGYDLRVLLGDLLTYGVDVVRTLDLVSNAVEKNDTMLILGNHDDIYTRLLAGQSELLPPVPDWVAAHIRWTLSELPTHRWAALPFRASFAVESVHFSHANPFGPADWTYLNEPRANLRAAKALRARGLSCGVFGHTHRARRFSAESGCDGGNFWPFDYEARPLDPARTHILNAGSVGQPRSHHPREVILWLDLHPTGTVHRFESLAYDLDAHRRSLLDSSLPDVVKRQCLDFHRE